MKLKIKSSTTSKKTKIFIQDNSITTTVAGLTGLTNASSGLTWYYIKDGDSSATQVTIVSATVGTFTSGGFKEVDATNMPGWYEIGIPNAALTSTACHMHLKGAANMVPVMIEIELDAIDYAAGTIALSATGLDNIPITAPAGVATGFREMVVQTWRRFFKKTDLTSTQLKTYADNGSSVLTTQTVSDDGSTQTQGAAS